MLLVVCGSPVLGAPVADAQQQCPPARAHGVRLGEVGVARGVGCGVSEGRLERGFLVGSRGFLVSDAAAALPRVGTYLAARTVNQQFAQASGGRALILSQRAHLSSRTDDDDDRQKRI